MAARQTNIKRNHSKEIQDILNDKDCEELDPDSGSVHTGNSRSKRSQPTSLNLPPPDGGVRKSGTDVSESPLGFKGVDVEGVALGDSPTAETMMQGMPDFSASTGSLGSGTRSLTAKQMTVTSPPAGWSGTSWTGGLAQGCAPAFKTSASVNDLHTAGSSSMASADTISLGKTKDANKLESIKNWTISTYKCSRQALFEKLGKTSRTVDTELETQIENLRDTQRKYGHILKLARALTSHFYHVIQTQSALGEWFSELAHKSPELQEEFLYNAETQRTLTKNGQTLIKALNFFVSSVNTLCNKTMEDTIATVKQYETARTEYDAYRSDLDYYNFAPKTDINLTKKTETEETFNLQKLEFERLRSDVQIKLKFLDENRVKVMHKQLLLLHNAVSAYFSGNQQALEATMKQFSINVKSPNSSTPSWIEQ